MADLVPGAQFEVIANAGHIPCIKQPAELVAAGFAVFPHSHSIVSSYDNLLILKGNFFPNALTV
jgi:hypothetical protein